MNTIIVFVFVFVFAMLVPKNYKDRLQVIILKLPITVSYSTPLYTPSISTLLQTSLPDLYPAGLCSFSKLFFFCKDYLHLTYNYLLWKKKTRYLALTVSEDEIRTKSFQRKKVYDSNYLIYGIRSMKASKLSAH